MKNESAYRKEELRINELILKYPSLRQFNNPNELDKIIIYYDIMEDIESLGFKNLNKLIIYQLSNGNTLDRVLYDILISFDCHEIKRHLKIIKYYIGLNIIKTFRLY